MAIDVVGAFEAAKKIADFVDFLGKKKAELSAKPQLAAGELALALDQIYATFQVVATEVGTFLALGASEAALEARAPTLAQLQGVTVRSRVRHGKGHCLLIGNIYRQHLDTWFRGALSETDYLMAQSGFKILGEADETLFQRMLAIAETISDEAAAVEDLTLEKKWEDARARVLSSRKDLRRMERLLGETMDQLSDLKDEFVAISGATNLQGK
jgi:hypothetical protein